MAVKPTKAAEVVLAASVVLATFLVTLRPCSGSAAAANIDTSHDTAARPMPTPEPPNPFDLAYGFICTRDEVRRISAPKNTQDALLRLRAEAVAENTRLYRVMRARKRHAGEAWCFEHHFSTKEFDAVRSQLPDDVRELRDLVAGFVFSNDPNGSCIRTPFGNIVVVSESLRHFLYFMNLAFLGFEADIPHGVRTSALTIGLRTMLQTEAMDFELDPRGVIPPDVHQRIAEHTERQLEFVIGHEFGHHALGHIPSAAIARGPSPQSQPSTELGEFYTYAHKQEFEADRWSLEVPQRADRNRAACVAAAILFFTYVDVFEQARDQMLPPSGKTPTHPPPSARRDCILTNEPQLHLVTQELVELANSYKESFQEHIATNIESFETYGSVYLDTWRGPIRIDRVDY